jgi:probable phosphoglycerate mutase
VRLILIRHAETDGNRRRYVGREDLPLNASGHAQAAALAAALASEPLRAVYSSPLTRALETARAIASGRGISVRPLEGLVEVDYGDLAGTVKGERPFRLRRDHLHVPMPGGESLTDVWGRLAPVEAELRAALALHGRVAVVGHYWSNRLLLARIRGERLEDSLEGGDYKPANASAYSVDLGGTDGRRVIAEGWRVPSPTATAH